MKPRRGRRNGHSVCRWTIASIRGTTKGLLNVSEKVNRHPLMIGNRVQMLRDGEEAYPAMLKAIGEAEKFIYLCSYIFDVG